MLPLALPPDLPPVILMSNELVLFVCSGFVKLGGRSLLMEALIILEAERRKVGGSTNGVGSRISKGSVNVLILQALS